MDSESGATTTSNAILEAVANCVKQAGGNTDALKSKKTSEASKKTEEVNYDIVVVEAGTLAGGLFAAESSLQKKVGKTVSKEWLCDEYMKSSSGYMNSILVRTIIDQSSETVNWLMKNRCELNLIDAGVGLSYVHVGMPTMLHG